MPGRLPLPPPDGREELRGWAEAVSDLHYVGSLIAEKAETFLPGEHVEDARAAWAETTLDFERIVSGLAPLEPGATGRITSENLNRAKLDGRSGSMKRSVRRLRDSFLGYFQSQPETDETQRKGREAAERHLDAGGVALDSLGACASEGLSG